MGKRNWLFASTEIGAQRVGIVQSLLVTCRLHSVDSYTYLVDVLQRVSVHPAKRVIELTPRMWKSLFADAPLRSDLGPHRLRSATTLIAITQPRPKMPAYREASLLQTLGPDPIASGVKRENLQHRASPIDEHEPVPTRRILPQQVAYLRRQSIKGTPHIRGPGTQPDALLRASGQHERARRNRNTIALPSSSSTSHSGGSATNPFLSAPLPASSTNHASSLCSRSLSIAPNLRRHHWKVLSANPSRSQKLPVPLPAALTPRQNLLPFLRWTGASVSDSTCPLLRSPPPENDEGNRIDACLDNYASNCPLTLTASAYAYGQRALASGSESQQNRPTTSRWHRPFVVGELPRFRGPDARSQPSATTWSMSVECQYTCVGPRPSPDKLKPLNSNLIRGRGPLQALVSSSNSPLSEHGCLQTLSAPEHLQQVV